MEPIMQVPFMIVIKIKRGDLSLYTGVTHKTHVRIYLAHFREQMIPVTELNMSHSPFIVGFLINARLLHRP